MLNFRVLYSLLNPRSVRYLIAVLAITGIGVLLEIVLLFRLSLLIGPWVVMSVLSACSAISLLAMHRLTESRSRRLKTMIDSGHFVPDAFSVYISTLLAAVFLVIPGFLSSITGSLLLIPPVAARTGRILAGQAGISWREAYEFLRLERLGD